MRLWSIHPKYLDTKGLVALWREGLLAQAVLFGRTIGYRNHPQLNRFKAHPCPTKAIATYLRKVLEEAKTRGYNFNELKIEEKYTDIRLPVTKGQITYEFSFLCEKVKVRAPHNWNCLKEMKIKDIDIHPLFTCVEGEVEPWEKVK